MRRLDYETVADCMPEDDRKLLIHIKKDQARKQRKKGASEEGSMVWLLPQLSFHLIGFSLSTAAVLS